MDTEPNLAAFTEIWLNASIGSKCIQISGYNLISKNDSVI